MFRCVLVCVGKDVCVCLHIYDCLSMCLLIYITVCVRALRARARMLACLPVRLCHRACVCMCVSGGGGERERKKSS